MDFDPFKLVVSEIQIQEVLTLIDEGLFYWALDKESTLKDELEKNDVWNPAFETIESRDEKILFSTEDTIVIVSPELRHDYGQPGFRYFRVGFKE